MTIISHVQYIPKVHLAARRLTGDAAPASRLYLLSSAAMQLSICAAAAAIWITVTPSAAAADDIPAFDIGKTCKLDSSAYPMPDGVSGCLNDEQSARQALGKSWAEFDQESRRECVQMLGDVTGTQSYVELLTCLQMAAEAKKLPAR